MTQSTETYSWPSFAADQTELKKVVEEFGATCVKFGRSGFASRNRYEVRLANQTAVDSPTQQQATEAKKLLQDAQNLLTERKKEFFLKEFQGLSQDGGTSAVMEVGGHHSNPGTEYYREFGFFMKLAEIRTKNTRDHRQNMGHTYAQILLDTREIQPNQILVLAIPDQFKGLVIGKGGTNIKRLQQELGVKIKIK